MFFLIFVKSVSHLSVYRVKKPESGRHGENHKRTFFGPVSKAFVEWKGQRQSKITTFEGVSGKRGKYHKKNIFGPVF